MKMYIAVLDEFPDYMTPTLVGHAVLRHHLEKNGNDNLYDDWLSNSFRKCVVRVSRKEFDKILQIDGVVGSWENNIFNGEVSCATVVVGDEIPKVLKFAKLWKPKEN